jgi:hypothetical protein
MTNLIEVGALLKTETAYDKDMNITHEGEEVRVILHWDSHDGYEMTWLDLEGRFINAPAWANRIDEEATAYPSGLGYFLDCLNAHRKKELW